MNPILKQTQPGFPKKPNPTARRKARSLALQAIYQWQLTQVSPLEIQNQFIEEKPLGKADIQYFSELLLSIPKHVSEIDAYIQPMIDQKIEGLNPIEHAILRIGIYELTYRLDIPYRVAIDEALRLAKIFGATDGFRFVNAVLDKVARKVRSVETKT